MGKNNKIYDEKSIESLSPLEFTRLRPGVYAGDCTYSTQLLVEIVSNAVDEFRLGHGTQIDVTIDKDVVGVRDYGQGFIVNSFRDDGKTILEAAFSVLNTSGKYRDDGTYEGTSLGSFGIGSKITTFLANWLIVSTYRDGQSETIEFKEGVFDKRTIETSTETGTYVQWKASKEFFTHPEVEIGKIRDLFSTISCLCPGLTINLSYNGKQESYTSKNGLNDLVDKAVGDLEIINNRCNIRYRNGKEQMDFVLTYTANYSSTIIPYVNTGLTEKGPHISTFKTIITREFNKLFRDKGWLKEKEDNLSGEDIQEGMYIVFNLTAANVGYDAQVKSNITKIDLTNFSNALAENLNIWFAHNEKDVKIIADKALAARRAREAAKKARDAARAKVEKKTKALKFASKLADCNSKDRKQCEIYITEGDSATGGLKMGRDETYQAVLPVRGKILNCQRATIQQIQKNAEIMTMIEAFGLDIDLKSMKVTYDKNKIRYGKIIIASDADLDGLHIKNLFYTFIWNFCPGLIEDGYIYACVPPLYKITEKNGNSYQYLKDDRALEKYRASHQKETYQVGRLKGLGEMSEDEVSETLMDPNNRIIRQITIADKEKADLLFEQMMGDSIAARKQFLKDYSEEANYVE